MKNTKLKNLFFKFGTLMLALAPVLVTKQASSLLWGEVEIPESLKNQE
ncbi:MAG: hypothetical protein U9Q80_06665 [Bacillota bacterium]|nr:hypothetical protein [Bacillota bacterium]